MAHKIVRPRKASRAGVYFWQLWNFDAADGLGAVGASILLPRSRNSAHRIYCAVTLFAGYVFLNEVGVLQPHELDGKAIVDVTHNAALRLSDGDHDADWRSQLAGDADRGAGLRKIDHAAGDIGAIG
jgi:hypothetical protein